jgi:hypothetical protein
MQVLQVSRVASSLQYHMNCQTCGQGRKGTHDDLNTSYVKILHNIDHRRVFSCIVWQSKLPVRIHCVKTLLLHSPLLCSGT